MPQSHITEQTGCTENKVLRAEAKKGRLALPLRCFIPSVMPCVPWIPWYLNRYPRKKNWFLNLYPPKKQLQALAGDDLHRNQNSIQPGMQETVFLCICVHQEFLFTSTVSYCLWTDRKDWYYRIHVLLNFALITHILGSSVSYSQAPCLYAALMVKPTPLKNMNQLGWWHSQLNGKRNIMFQTTKQQKAVSSNVKRLVGFWRCSLSE